MTHRQSRTNGLAVLIIDMQAAYLERLTKSDRELLIQTQLNILYQCVRSDIPVFFLEYWDEGPTVPELLVAAAHVRDMQRLTKRSDDAFASTSIAMELHERKITRLLLCGINASFCVKKTAQGARRCGFQIETANALIADGVAHASQNKSKGWFKRNGVWHSALPVLAH